MNSIKDFYDRNPFPGPYTIDQLKNYQVDNNPYISIIDSNINDDQKILDVGCGAGLITNLLASRYTSEFTGVDFSVAADIAADFATNHHITNATFIKQNFLNFQTNKKFDVIIAQSFLNHVPEYGGAINKLKSLLAPGGTMIVGIYNDHGKFAKKFFKVDYGNDRLRLDQECNPYEVSFSHQEVLDQWNEFQLKTVYPSWGNRFVGLRNLLNSRNGGLTMYVFKDSNG